LSSSDLSDLDLNLILGEQAAGLDTDRKEVTVGGDAIRYDGLIIATGARARKLSKSGDIDGIHVLRTVDDALAIRSGLKSNSAVVIVGAGFIGAEVAAAARQHDCQVTIVEASEAPLVRGLGHQVGSACGELHRYYGVDLRLGIGVADVHGRNGLEEVELTDGTYIETEFLVVGIGSIPNTEWLVDSGLSLDDGVVCNENLNAGIPGIYAAGDVAKVPNRWLGGRAEDQNTGHQRLSTLRWRQGTYCFRTTITLTIRCRLCGQTSTKIGFKLRVTRLISMRWSS